MTVKSDVKGSNGRIIAVVGGKSYCIGINRATLYCIIQGCMKEIG
jgi:hypothetical protein